MGEAKGCCGPGCELPPRYLSRRLQNRERLRKGRTCSSQKTRGNVEKSWKEAAVPTAAITTLLSPSTRAGPSASGLGHGSVDCACAAGAHVVTAVPSSRGPASSPTVTQAQHRGSSGLLVRSARPVSGDAEVAQSLGATGRLVSPVPALPPPPAPRPGGEPTPGSAGPAPRSSLPRPSGGPYCNRSPPCTGARRPGREGRRHCHRTCCGRPGTRGGEGGGGEGRGRRRAGRGAQKAGRAERRKGEDGYPEEGARTGQREGAAPSLP